jgi:hypothetical protein
MEKKIRRRNKGAYTGPFFVPLFFSFFSQGGHPGDLDVLVLMEKDLNLVRLSPL